jgi:UV DNA damage endonuclease
MSLRLGYACINQHLSDTQRITASRTMRKATFQSKGLPAVSNLIVSNLESLSKIMQWNVANGFTLYRMSSTMFPWASEYKFNQLPDYTKIRDQLASIGQFAIDNGIRLSFHPGQFVCLGSHNPVVVENSILDLEIHGRIMDWMLQPRNHNAKINIHIGGAYNDKPGTAKRFLKVAERLTAAVYDRFTVENDDRLNLYTTQELYDMIYSESGIPIVFDYHHHACNPGDLCERDALALAISTWQNAKPCTHYSESAQLERGEKAPFRAHSNYIYSKIDDHGFDIDCVVEAKAKEQAVLKYYSDHGVK